MPNEGDNTFLNGGRNGVLMGPPSSGVGLGYSPRKEAPMDLNRVWVGGDTVCTVYIFQALANYPGFYLSYLQMNVCPWNLLATNRGRDL